MPTPSPEIPHPGARLGRNVRTTWTYTLGSLVFILLTLDATLLLFALTAFTATHDVGAGLLFAALAAAVLTQLRYCWFLRTGLGGGLPSTGWTLALLLPAVAVWVLGLFSGMDAVLWVMPLWLAVSILACLLPKRPRYLVLGAGVAAAVLHAVLYAVIDGLPYGWPENSGVRMLLVYAAGIPLVLLSSLWWWNVVVELDRHRLMAGELAVAQERLRFAADLHDIQGHHLQVIALKSELAERLLPIDPDAARENIRETRLIAKQALEETRSLVAGYRETSLDNELENAREVLTAAGAHCELSVATLPRNPAIRTALAMTVREATTNILRHSDATQATITLAHHGGEATLTVGNNGLVATPSDIQSPGTRITGTGIAGLRERVEVLGGTLETILSTDRFELRVCVPTERTTERISEGISA